MSNVTHIIVRMDHDIFWLEHLYLLHVEYTPGLVLLTPTPHSFFWLWKAECMILLSVEITTAMCNVWCENSEITCLSKNLLSFVLQASRCLYDSLFPERHHREDVSDRNVRLVLPFAISFFSCQQIMKSNCFRFCNQKKQRCAFLLG